MLRMLPALLACCLFWTACAGSFPQNQVASPGAERDVDFDGDGLTAEADACPKVPEDFDAVEDDDGCPDLLVHMDGDRIVTSEPIYFNTGKNTIMVRSHALLDDVVFLLEAMPDVSVRVEGHTDSRGSAKYNTKLSHMRAAEVVNYLTQQNIDASRLTFQGYGEDRPIDSNQTREGRKRNRRIDFVIVRPTAP